MGTKPTTEKENLCKKRFDPEEQLTAVFLETNWIRVLELNWEQLHLNGEVNRFFHMAPIAVAPVQKVVFSLF